MTDPRETPSLAEHAAFPRDLPPPPFLSAQAAEPVALFLDFDGTLVEIADHPDGVTVPPDLPALIARLSERLDGRFAVVTGRSLDALEALLGPLDVAVAGSHGGEFRPAGSRTVEALAQPLPEDVTARLSAFAKAHGGLLVEPKPFSIAVHYRRHPEALPALLACAEETAAVFALKLKHGKQVIELAMPGSDKGSAVRRFMEAPSFAGATPLFVGDDVTDEDAFAAVSALGGAGILVGPLRQTHAAWRLGSVAEVHAWLAAIADTNSHKENSPA
jgi:trehalose 6-phosphate phosphatase